MHLKTKIPNFLTPDPDRKTQNCINIKNELIQNMHKIYQQQGEEASSRKGAIQPYHLFDPGDYVDFPPFNRTPDVQNICVELKLKLDVRHADGESDPDSSIFLDINPGGVMSRNQRTFVYQYRSTHPVLDKGLDQLTREQRMKYFTALSHQLAGRSITFQGTTYKLLNVLQTAIYGGVYLAQVVDSTDESSVNKKKAIKILSKHLIELAKDKVQEDPLSEYHYRKCMSGHSNILSCDIIFDDDYYVYMIMPFAVHGDLFEVMKTRSKPFTEQEAKYLFYQILLSIKFLHCRKLALRDISLENILLFENEQNGLIYPVLNDPGQATHFRVNKKNEVTLLEYTKIFGKIFRPPEVYEKCKYDPTRVDMFCVGYILYFCLTKHELFRCTLEKDMHWNMLKSRHYHELLREKKGLHLSEPALDLIFRCLEPNFKMRLEIGEALRHPWFKGNFFPVHRQSLFLPQGDDTMDEGSAPSGGPPSPMYKLSKEIELCAKRKNVAIDHNTSIRFSIYEHVIAPPQGYFSGGNNPSTCLNSTHRREYPPECEPNAEDDHIRGKRAEDTPRWPPPSMATPTRTDLNSIFKGIPHYVGSHPYGSGYHKGTFPTSPTDYLRHNMARGAHFPSVQGIYAKQSAPVRKSPPLVEKAGWIKKYEDSVSTHTCHTNWTEEDKQSSFHNSPQNCSQIREKSKSNFLMRHKKGAYRMIGMKRKKQKLSSDATAEEVDRGDNLFVESSISSLHVMVRQSLQTGAQDDTLKTVQKSPHILTTAEATKGRGLLSIFSERQLPNGGELPKNGTFTKKIDYPIGPFEGRSFIHVEEGHSGWGIMSRKNTPLEWNKNINGKGMNKLERVKDEMIIQQRDTNKREFIDQMEEMKPPQCETPWKVKRSESCGDVHMEGFTEEAEETYTVELEGVVSPMNGSPLHDVTVVTEGDTPQRTDRMDTNDSNEKNEETKNSIPYNPNGGNGNGFFDLNEVLIEKRNAPHGVVHLGEEAPPNGLHKGDPCRGVKRWCSLGGREIVWNDFYTKGVFTPGKENSYGGEITPSVCTGSHTDQRPHPSESKENVKGTPSNEEVNKGKIPPHRNASYAYMKDETESPRLNCPSCEDNYSDVVTSHVESLKRCASHNNCEEQNQTGSKSFDRCSEGESRQMCSIFSRSVSCSMDQGKASTSDNLITTMSSCLSEVDLEIDMANMKREWSTQDGSKDRTFTLQGGEAEATCSEIMDRGLLSGEPNDEEEDFKDALEYELEHELQREIREEERQLERELEVELETDVKLDKVSYVKVNVDPYVDPDVVQLHAASSCASGGGNLNHEGASASAKEKVRNGSNCTLKEQYESMSYVEGQPGLPPQWQEGNAVKMHPNNTWNHSTSTKKGNQEIKTACKNSLSGKKRELVGDITVEEDTMRKRVAVSGISTKRSTPCKFQLRKKKSTSKMKKVYSSANPEKKKSRIVRLQKCVLSEGLRNSRSGPAKGGTPKSGIATKGIPVIGTVSSVKPHPLGKHLEALHRKDRDGTNGIGSIIDCTSRKGIPKTKTKMSCDRKKCLSKRHTISELRPVGGGNIISDIGGNTHAKALPDLRATKTSSKIHSAKSAGAKSILLHLPDTRMIVEKLRDFGKRHTISNATTDRRSREGIQTHSVKSRYGGDCLPKGGVRGMQVIPASRGTVGMISLKDDMKAGNGIRSSVGGVLTTQVAKWNGRHVETKARRNHNQVHRTCSEERNQKELIKNHVDKEFKGKEKSTFVKLHRGGESPTEEPTTIDKDSLLQRFNKTGLYANGEKAHVDHGLGSEDEIPTAAERKERVLLKKDFPQMWERGELDKHRAGERVQGYQDVLLHCLVGKDDPSHYRSAVSEKMPERVKGRSTRTVEIPLGKDYSKDKSVLRTDPHMVVTPRQLRISGKKRPEETPTGRRKENGRTRISSDELVLNRFLAKMGGNIPARVPKRESIKKGGSKSIQPNKVNAHVERRANVIKQKSSLCRSVVGSQRGNNAKEGEKERKKEETKKTKKNESRRTKDGVIKRGGAHVGGDREKYPNGVTPSRVELREGKKDSYLEKRKTYVFFLKKGLKGKLEKMNQKAEAEKHRKKVEGILQKRTEMSKSPTDANRSKKTLEGENPREEEQKKLYEKVYPGEPQDVPPLESKNLHGQMTTCRYTPHVNEKGKEVSFHSENNGLMNGSCHQSVRDIGVEVRSEVTSPRGNINLSDERKVVHFSHLDSKNGRSNHSLGIPSVAVSWKDTSNFHRNGNDGEMGHDIRPSSPSNAQKGGVQAPDVSFTGRGKDVPIGGNITQGYSPRGPYQIGSVKTAREGDLESFSRRTPTGDTRYADKVNLERSMEGEKVSTNRVACMSSYWDNPNDEGSHTPVAWRPMLHRRMVGGASKGERTTPMETDPMIASRTDTNVAGESATGGKKRTDGNAKRGTEGEKYNQNEPTNFTQHQVGTRRCSNDRTVNAHGNIKQEFLSHAKEKMKRLLNLNDEMQRSGEKNVLQVNSNMGSPSMWWSHLEQGTNTYLQDGQRKKKQSGNPCLNLKGDEMKKVFRSAPHLVHLDPSKVASNMAMSALSPRDITPGGVSPTVKAAQIVPCNVVQKEEAHTASPFSGHNNYPIAKGMNPNGPTLRAYQLPNTKPYGAQNVFVRCNEQKVAYPMGDASGRRSQLEKSKNDQNRVNRNDAYAQVLGTTYQGGTNRTYMSLHGPIGYTNPGQTKNNLISGEKKKNSNFSILWWKT